MQPGDLVLCHGQHFSSKLIRFGQRLRFRGSRRRFAYFNHVAMVIGEDGALAEALSRGVVRSNIAKYAGTDYRVVHVKASTEDRVQMLAFAQSVLRARWRYGYWTIAALFFTLTVGSKFVVGKIGSAICSGFAADALTRAGYVWDKPPSYMLPADLAEFFDV